MTKQLLYTLCLCFLCCIKAWGQPQDKPAYLLYDAAGKQISYSDLIKGLGGYDAVFLGEMHNCPITHWLEFEITKSLYALHGDKLTIGAEMLECDNQLILDEYMKGLITSDRFEAEARLWHNHSTDYEPVVYFAKEHAVPFVATNVPRRYANSVKNHGFSILEKLSPEAKKYLPPLPIPFVYDAESSEATFGVMRMMGGHSAEDTRRLAEAQAVKDATMAWFIAQNFRHKFLHLNGSLHSDQKGGIIPYLLRYRPKTTVATVLFVRQEDISALEEIHFGRAEYYVCIPEDMVHSY